METKLTKYERPELIDLNTLAEGYCSTGSGNYCSTGTSVGNTLGSENCHTGNKDANQMYCKSGSIPVGS